MTARLPAFGAFALVQAGLIAAFATAALHGTLDPLLYADTTYLTQGILALAVGAVLHSWFAFHAALAGHYVRAKRAIGISSQLAEILTGLGLLGTVVGFVMALSHVDPGTASDVGRVAGMISGMVEGMGTALYTTIAGALGSLWLAANLTFAEYHQGS